MKSNLKHIILILRVNRELFNPGGSLFKCLTPDFSHHCLHIFNCSLGSYFISVSLLQRTLQYYFLQYAVNFSLCSDDSASVPTMGRKDSGNMTVKGNNWCSLCQIPPVILTHVGQNGFIRKL